MAPPPDAIAALLKQLDLPDHSGDPQTLLRNVHKAWKSAGGTYGGKPRHSDRFLTEQLKEQGIIVRSLTPKLAGHTRIKRKDAEILMSHFLTHWPKGGDGAAEALDYAPLLDKKTIREIADHLADEYDNIPLPQATAPLTAHHTLPGEEISSLLHNLYENCDALITVGTEKAVLRGAEDTYPLKGFRNIINDWWEIEQNDGRKRPLIWVLDLGRQTYEDPEPAFRFLAVHDILVRLKALRYFQDRQREKRLEWLSSRAVFIVLDPVRDQPFNMAGFRRPSFLPHHISFSAIPPEWAKSANFRALYGSDLDRLNQRTFTVVFKGHHGWPTGSDDDDELKYWRYFGHASFAVEPKQNPEGIGRSLELPSPGASYEEAYRTVYSAAVSLLNLKNELPDAIRPDPDLSAAQLRYLGFRILRLEEFEKI